MAKREDVELNKYAKTLPFFGSNRHQAEKLNEQLINAAKTGNISAINKLIKKGADVNGINVNLSVFIRELNHCATGISALAAAAAAGREDTVAELLKLGADPNACRGKTYVTPLHLTAQSYIANSETIADMLISNGAQVNIRDNEGITPLMYALSRRKYSLAEFFIKYGADIQTVSSTGDTPLCIAAGLSDGAGLVRKLISLGAPVDAKNKYGSTPLLMSSSAEVSEILLNLGADINAVNSYGSTPAHIAAYHGKSAILALLLSRGADIHVADMRGLTLLHSAVSLSCGSANKECAKMLLDHGADINAKNWRKETPFHFACRFMKKRLIQMMMKYSPDLNACDEDGATPLMRLADRGMTGTMSVLTKAGADISIKNRYGETALDILKSYDQETYEKWIRTVTVQTKKKILRREDSAQNHGDTPDFNI